MDRRLRITEPPRKIAAGVAAETPLVVLAWHALRSERRREAEADDKLQDALLRISAEVGWLRRTALAAASQAAPPAAVQGVRDFAHRIEAALKIVGVALLGEELVLFVGELAEVLDNVAQLPEAGIATPLIAEVVEPAILWKGALLRRGKR